MRYYISFKEGLNRTVNWLVTKSNDDGSVDENNNDDNGGGSTTP